MQQFVRQFVKRVLRKEQQKSFLSTSAGSSSGPGAFLFFWAMVANLTSSTDADVSQQRSKSVVESYFSFLGNFSTCSLAWMKVFLDEGVSASNPAKSFFYFVRTSSTDESTLLPSTTWIGVFDFVSFSLDPWSFLLVSKKLLDFLRAGWPDCFGYASCVVSWPF